MSQTRREIHLVERPTALEPWKILLTVLALSGGATLAIQGAAPATVEESLPDWVVFLWGCELIIGSLLILVGSFIGSWFLENNGLWLSGASALVYAMILLVAAWPASVLVAAYTAGYAATCFVSIWLAGRVPIVVRVRKRGGDAP